MASSEGLVMALELVPVTLLDARKFVRDHHRHCDPPFAWRFGVGVAEDGELVGVAMANMPVNRAHAVDRFVLEVQRTCTTGAKNANSMLYGAVARAAKALGYRSLITYTLEGETGASLRAAGWVAEAEVLGKPGWLNHPRPAHPRLFGERKVPEEQKIRWRKTLT
jgi:hypothetical protein